MSGSRQSVRVVVVFVTFDPGSVVVLSPLSTQRTKSAEILEMVKKSIGCFKVFFSFWLPRVLCARAIPFPPQRHVSAKQYPLAPLVLDFQVVGPLLTLNRVMCLLYVC